MEFKKYNSLENSYRQKFIDQIVEQGKSHGTWVVQEKIHGANFSFFYDGKNLMTGKRTAFLGGEGENFYNSHKIKDIYSEAVIQIFNLLSKDKKKGKQPVESIIVYGELYGGNYPHKEVENNSGFKSIQNGVFYNPDVDFYAFDIKVNDEFLGVQAANSLFEELRFFHAKTLFSGTLEKCLEYANEFQTTIPGLLGLPEIENNICEGVVIRPVDAKYLFSGSRVIIKNKNEKFAEKDNKKPKIKKEVELTPGATKILEEALTFVTENRLRNVISKIGTITDKDFGKLMGFLNKDTIEDFLKDNKEEFIVLDKKEQKYVTKKIGSENANIIRKDFLNIIDNTF